MERRRSIYALIDPRDRAIRYVGATQSSLAKRLGQHLAPSKLARPSPLTCWLSELLGAGLKPYLGLLDTVPADRWRQAEQEWITRLKAEGHSLVNISNGGSGSDGCYRWSEEARARMSRSHAGIRRGGKGKYVGVSIDHATGRWRAVLANTYLGLYDSEEDAFSAYKEAFLERYGQDVPPAAIRPDLLTTEPDKENTQNEE